MSEVKLDRVHQIFIIQKLAMFERGIAIQKALKDEYDIEISRAAISYYKISNPNLPKDLKKLFTKTRNNFLKDASKIPIAQKAFRLSKLQQMFEAEEDQSPLLQNKKTMRALLKQAAKESGDAFTNKQKVEVSDPEGKSLIPSSITVNIVESNSIIKDEPDSN